MSWSTLTVAQVLAEGGFSAPEKTALDAQAGASAGTLADTLTNVIQTVRGVVTATGATAGAAGTVPDSLRMDIVALVRWRWLIAFPSLRALQTEERKQAAERAEERLDEVAAGDRAVEAADPATQSTVAGCAGGQVRLPMRTDNQDKDYSAA
jgi:hypothetical protein